jgi:hypothetical protein
MPYFRFVNTVSNINTFPIEVVYVLNVITTEACNIYLECACNTGVAESDLVISNFHHNMKK